MTSLHNVDRNIPILVVDDTLNTRKNLKKALVSLGFKNISEAEDGPTALEMINEEAFTLIISDRDMPEVNGLELLEKVRTHEQLSSAAFVMVASEVTKEKLIEAAQAGVSSYMVKPFTVEQLREKLDSIAGALH